jgi:hypothetical protein
MLVMLGKAEAPHQVQFGVLWRIADAVRNACIGRTGEDGFRCVLRLAVAARYPPSYDTIQNKVPSIYHISKLTDFGDVAYDNILTQKAPRQNTFAQ